MDSMGLNLMDLTMRKLAGNMGETLPPRPILPCEIGCIESDFQDLPARRLFMCVSNRRARVADLEELLSAEAPLAAMVNDVDGDSFGLLHHLAYGRSDPAMIDVLVRHGADVNLRGCGHDETPLVLAALYCRLGAVERLLEHCARTDPTDCHGHTALARARQERGPNPDQTRAPKGDRQRIVSLLERAAAAQRLEVGSGGRSRIGESEGYRKAGNDAFAAGQYQQALDTYTRSLQSHEDYRTYANRAACWLRLGLARYRERRASSSSPLVHQICDGGAKIVRWVPGCDGSCSTPDAYNGRGPPGPFGDRFPAGVYCNACCSPSYADAYRCRSVEMLTKTIANFYRQAVSDASRAKTLEPTYAKAHYRAARANVGLRDFPRARLCLEEGLRHCPDHREMAALLEKLLQMGVGPRDGEVRMSNPLSGASEREFPRGGEAMTAGDAYIMCAYCTAAIAHPSKKKLRSLGRSALAWSKPTGEEGIRVPTGKGKLSKEEALVRAGFPTSCYHCACNPCADVDQRAIREMIEAP
jgi:tetratricopeptide (TPR) repeat protein